MRFNHVLGVVLVSCFGFASAAPAATVIDFTEVAQGTSLNGLTIKGVTFADTAGGLVLGGPGIETYVSDPSALSEDGTITMSFATTTKDLSFGMAFSANFPYSGAASISLFDSSNALIGNFTLDALLVDPFAEGLFSYSGSVGIKTATITTNSGGNFAFVLDNITFNSAAPGGGGPAGVPLPAAVWAGLAIGGAVVGKRARVNA